MADVDKYLNLITTEYGDQPKFVAVMRTILSPLVDAQNVVMSIPAKFDLDLAVGQQLDFAGQWIGLSRQLLAPITDVYFAFDTAGLGFDEGVWLGPGDPTEGLITLDDNTYRFMLKIKVAANSWNGSLGEAQRILQEIVSGDPGTSLFLQDNFNMTMDIGVVGDAPNAVILALLTQGYIAIRPAGVLINDVTVSPGPIFGFDNDNYLIGGFDHGIWS